MTTAVVFDIGNVVCAFEPERRLEALARRTGLEPQHIDAAIWGAGLDARADAGELALAELERELLDALDHRIDRLALRTAWSAAFVPDPAVCAIVRRIDQPVFAFTNNGPMLTECLAHELIEVADLFERVVYSWQVGASKSDPVAFERFCAAVGRRPDALLFVDDSAGNTASARSIGFDTITFTTAEALAIELAQRGVLP